MKNRSMSHQSSVIVPVVLLILFSSITFSQQYKTKYDTVDCAKYSCEQWGMKNASCIDMGLEQWPAHCASCGQLSLFLQGKFDEMDYNVYNSVLSCTIRELECKLAKELGFIPSLSSTYVYHESSLSSENRINSVYENRIKYKISEGWTGDTYVYSKIVIDKPQDASYIGLKIGSGKCGIKKKIRYVDNGNDDTVPILSVAAFGDTPITTAQILISRFDSRLKSNYETAKAHIYNQLNIATNGLTENEKQDVIHSIKWSYSDSRMSATACEEDYFGNEKEFEEEIIEGNAQDGEIIEEENTTSTNDEVVDSTSNLEVDKEHDWPTDIDDITIVESPNLNPEDSNNVDSENTDNINSINKDVNKQIVCASAKPSITSGSEFKQAKFNIGGNEPQEIKITSPAENFAIVKEYGGLVYQMIDGKSWGRLILEPGSYILSCNGGGAMGLMSATACIKVPSAGKILPPDVPPILPRPDKKEKPTLIDPKPLLPKGPIEKIFVRSAESDDDITNDRLIMLIDEEKSITVWGVDAGGNEQNVSVDDWKVYDEDIGWITKDLHNPASKDARMKIKFKAGNKKGHTRIKATVINKENRRISGVLSIEVTKYPPITVTGCVKLYDENNNTLYAGGVNVSYQGIWFESRQAHDQVVDWMKVTRDIKDIRTDHNGKFKFVSVTDDKFVSLICRLASAPYPPPSGYKWNSTPNKKGDFNRADWKGTVKPGDAIQMVEPTYGCLSYFLKKVPITYYIGGKVTYRGNPVEGAKVRLVSNGKILEQHASRYNGQYWLDVGNLPKGTYILTADYKPVDETKVASPENTITLGNWLSMRNKITVDLPLPTQEETIDINLISWKDKIGYTGP